MTDELATAQRPKRTSGRRLAVIRAHGDDCNCDFPVDLVPLGT